QPFSFASMGGGSRMVLADGRSLANWILHRSSERRDVLALSGNARTVDSPGSSAGKNENVAPQTQRTLRSLRDRTRIHPQRNCDPDAGGACSNPRTGAKGTFGARSGRRRRRLSTVKRSRKDVLVSPLGLESWKSDFRRRRDS